MPLPQNINVILGAGVFGIVCAATLYVVEHMRQDRRRHAMAKDLARLNTELAVLRKELDSLLAQQKQKVAKRQKRNKKDSFVTSSSTTEDYSSALDVDSSDLEFYDVSDEEGEKADLDVDLQRIDRILDEGNVEELTSCLEQLENLCMEFPENPQLLWRIAKAHCKIYGKTEVRDHIAKGIDALNTALTLKPELANVHKWMAILLGERMNFASLKEKIIDSLKFKKHLDVAVKMDPMDATVQYMCGRYAYDMAELKWYERKVAAALAAEMPYTTHEEALGYFLAADKLSEKEWKENSLFIAKCQIKLGLVEEAVTVLEKAEAAEPDNGVDAQVDTEIKELLTKYRR